MARQALIRIEKSSRVKNQPTRHNPAIRAS
jgi:hypothetical protein